MRHSTNRPAPNPRALVALMPFAELLGVVVDDEGRPVSQTTQSRAVLAPR